MRRSKLYVLLSIITLICLLGAAAICNLGEIPFTGGDTSEKPSEEAKKVAEERDIAIESEITEDSGGTKQIEKQASGSQAPTIDLLIYEGPALSEDGICYFRIEAIVSGSPAPTVTFSKDDSNGTLGPLKTQINLTDPEDTYTLTATAENPSGSVNDTIVLSWGCSPATKGGNSNPVVYDINVTGGTPLLWPDSKYGIYAVTADPDGDSLSYQWTVSEGSIDDIYSNPSAWNTPDAGGTYSISISVDDGNGGTDSLTKSVFISQTTLPVSPITTEFPIVVSESGIWEIDRSDTYERVIPQVTTYEIGDTEDNWYRTACISFDISGLSSDILSAHLTFNLSSQTGDPSPFMPLRVKSVYWGPYPFIERREILGFGTVCEVNGPNFSADNGNLKEQLLSAIEGGRDRFQIWVYFRGVPSCDDDYSADLWIYDVEDISLTVTYRPSS
jgi:hypothetical protein